MKDSDNPQSPAAKTTTTEEYLLSVTVGERKPLNSSIYLAPYNPDWPSQFLRQASHIREALSDAVLLLEHE